MDSVLAVMVRGLEEELKERLAGGRQLVANESPSAQYEIIPIASANTSRISDMRDITNQKDGVSLLGSTATERGGSELPMKKQGVSLGDFIRRANRAVKFVGGRRNNSNNSSSS